MRLTALKVGALVVAAACSAQRAAPGARPHDTQQLLSQWAAYDSAVAHWLRDSTIVDSVARRVPIDSLVALLSMQDRLVGEPMAVAQALVCEVARIGSKYGRIDRVVLKRAEATVWPREADMRTSLYSRCVGGGYPWSQLRDTP